LFALSITFLVILPSGYKKKYAGLDLLIERKLNGWKHLAEVYEDNISSTRPNKFQISYKTILPKVDPLVEDVILNQQQNQEYVENDIHAHQAAMTNFFAV